MVDIVVNGSTFSVEKRGMSNGEIELVVNGKPVVVDRVSSFDDSSTQLLRIGRRLLLCKVADRLSEDSIVTWINDKRLLVELSTDQEADSRKRASLVNTGQMSVEAPMAGRIVDVRVSPGKEVQEGQSLVILEAMKMENEIAAPRNGRVREVYVHAGSVVKTGDKLLVLD